MLAYAAERRPRGRSHSPSTLALILVGHALLIGAVMTAKMDLGSKLRFNPTDVIWVPETLPPPPDREVKSADTPRHTPSVIDQVPPLVPPLVDSDPVAIGPRIVDPTPTVGADPEPTGVPPQPKPVIVRKAARFATPTDDVRPPYPESKRRSEEEASLRLAITIDARGRVTSVEPVGAADPVFLEAARRHILKRWRYTPATEDGSAVASRTVITLKFELDD